MVTAPNGQSVDLLGADLTHAYRMGFGGACPAPYVASPRPAADS